jgi:tripartite-type tricarboxylate transporter receptor subunit TctC
MRIIIKFCLLLICCLTGISSAQTYPNKTVTIVVPFAPGGVTDVVARLYARKLSTLTGGNFNVENKAGAGGTIGTDFVARAPKDGYVLGMMIDSHTITPALMAKLSYDPIKDFTPIGMMALGQHVIVAHPSFAPSSIKELIDFAKAKPGEPYASSGTGTAQHLGMEMLKLKAGIDLTHIPYKGGGQAINDVVGGQVKVAILGIAPALPFIKTGQLKVLAVTGDSRLALFPQTSTVKETIPDFVTLQWFSMMAPAGIPKEVQTRLHELLARVSQDPEILQRLSAVGLDVQLSVQPGDLIRFMEQDLAKWPTLVKAAGIKPE